MEAERESSFYVVKLPPSLFETDPEASIRVSQSTSVPARFTTPSPQPEFESIFRSYGEEVAFVYLKGFSRVRVTYPDPEQCSKAWANLRRYEFLGSPLQLRPITVRD